MKKFVMYGAGNIGRGFIGQLFSLSGYSVGFVDINKEVIARLNQDKEYPVDVVSNDGIEEIAVKNRKVVAIGEIGLDYHYEGYDREAQIKLFREQVTLAGELDLPIIIHSRDAMEDTLEILRELRPKGVMHCYSGSAETARELLDLGLYISMTGVLTIKNAKKSVKVLEMLPLDRFMLETDCPYMAPEPNRGKRCDSSLIPDTARKAAEVKGISYEELVAATKENAIRLFGLDI